MQIPALIKTSAERMRAAVSGMHRLAAVRFAGIAAHECLVCRFNGAMISSVSLGERVLLWVMSSQAPTAIDSSFLLRLGRQRNNRVSRQRGELSSFDFASLRM